jgi:hypothetical protein
MFWTDNELIWAGIVPGLKEFEPITNRGCWTGMLSRYA